MGRARARARPHDVRGPRGRPSEGPGGGRPPRAPPRGPSTSWGRARARARPIYNYIYIYNKQIMYIYVYMCISNIEFP